MDNLTGPIFSELTQGLSTVPGITTLITILQTAGILLIGYLIFLFFRGILQYKKFSKIKNIDKTLSNIEKSLANIEEKLTKKNKDKAK